MGRVANSTFGSHYCCLAFSPEQQLLEGVACWTLRFPQTTVSITSLQDPVDKSPSPTPLPGPTLQKSVVTKVPGCTRYLLEGLGCLVCFAGWLGPRRFIPPPEDSQLILHVLGSGGAEEQKRVDQLSPQNPCKLGVQEAVGWSEWHLLLHGVPPL